MNTSKQPVAGSVYTKKELNKFLLELLALKERGVLTEKELSEVVAYVCSLFVEREIERRFAQVFNRRINLAGLVN